MHKQILKQTILLLMLDMADTFLANAQTDSQADTPFAYA